MEKIYGIVDQLLVIIFQAGPQYPDNGHVTEAIDYIMTARREHPELPPSEFLALAAAEGLIT